jgi:phage tail tape-measure protein
MKNIKTDSLIRVTEKKNENGDKTTEIEWEPGSKEKIAAGAAAGAALGSVVPVIGTAVGTAVGATLAFLFG